MPSVLGDAGHELINRKHFDGARHPLEGVFNMTNPDVLRYFEREAKENDEFNLDDHLKTEAKACTARLQAKLESLDKIQ